MSANSFAEIYAQWEESHDESSAMAKRANVSRQKEKESITISMLRNMKVQDELDLHNFLLDEAIRQTNIFIEDCAKRGLRKIRIITGKGLHSPNGESVIRPAIVGLVKNCRKIREADFNPKAVDGGSGAIILILK